MTGVLYLYRAPIGSIKLDDLRLTHTRPGSFLSPDEIIAGKLMSAPARKELTDLVKLHLSLPHSAQVRYDLHKTSKARWVATCYTGADTYLCEVVIRIRL